MKSLGWLLLLLTFFFVNIYATPPFQAFVSVLPLKFFVDNIAGGRVRVHVLVRPGYSPESYAPTPKQMVELRKSKLFFRVGAPFEKAWLKKIESICPKVKVVDLRPVATKNTMDPHIWNDPLLVMKMAKIVANSLEMADKKNGIIYKKNYKLFVQKLRKLNDYLKSKIGKVKGGIMLVYHPAWGYFAKRYGLNQLSIEEDGKAPGPKSMVKIVRGARKEGVKALFVSPQFSKKQADVVARSIGAKIVEINPLAENYLQNMHIVADKISYYLRK